ncbi:hypothetical protein BSY239_689 [Hydrogenophaga sp. RAC07]|nr:hypothetical protein BSY239_689 [Hydrogenophaga sp. RAC07]
MTASDYIAICSVFIAICAVYATYWQTQHARRHSELSVRPLLCWHKRKMTTEAGCVVTFTVKNLGLGPAIVRKRFFAVGGERFDVEPDDTDLVEMVASKSIGDKFAFRVLQSGTPGEGSALPSGGDFLIAELLFFGMDIKAAEKALRSLADLDFVVEYESMYEEPFTLRALGGNSPGWESAR